ncbi:hypothetical protein ASPWEDRAFT_29251 [Aspergillus wentii DTO 134E9]|uniref:DUF1275 domain protein n=1 Tax=Aspergillus wentii DTO 134E9 TaxID=1073089 RepID=A0A1L9RGU4_ASPWE|nr:uncharacterized protein ASPWEDRAFT_29251 [Aspergillus wentii DTO 134E9]KAI9927859.1 hypothetical protein MW887_002711 [Aspergillus wentii]OJJ34077.1 hypothetical protein ASPWEDRAFT_29251 [Aspergillus wentii DTO 134E9]
MHIPGHHQPSPVEQIQGTAPHDPPSQLRFNDERKEGGQWSVAGSTDVSLSGNQATSEQFSSRSALFRYFAAEIDPKRTDLILIACGFVGGLVDGLSFNAWGSFSSMQTGNTVFIALGVSGQPEYPQYLWAKSLIALATFLTSNLFFIHGSRLLNPLRRSTVILSFAIQTAAILAAAILVQLGTISPKPENPRAPIEWMQVLPISLLAFQAGGQIVASRILAFDEIPTVVLTTLLCDLLVDTKLYVRPWKANPKRNRRIGAFLALFLGAMTAGGLSKVTGLASSLWFAMAIKLTMTLSFFVWRVDKASIRRKRDEESGTE